MKKITFVFILSTIIAFVFFVYNNKSTNDVSELANNIEALADGEGSASCSASAMCFKDVYNPKTHQWEEVSYGSVSCTGTEECISGEEGYVICDGVKSSCRK